MHGQLYTYHLSIHKLIDLDYAFQIKYTILGMLLVKMDMHTCTNLICILIPLSHFNHLSLCKVLL
jgi:hypothetical protein